MTTPYTARTTSERLLLHELQSQTSALWKCARPTAIKLARPEGQSRQGVPSGTGVGGSGAVRGGGHIHLSILHQTRVSAVHRWGRYVEAKVEDRMDTSGGRGEGGGEEIATK